MPAQPHDADRAAPLSVLTSLATALDMANGLFDDKSLLTAVVAARIADELGATPALMADAFLTGLLRHLGCTAYAPTESTFAQNDQLLRQQLMGVGGSAIWRVPLGLLDANPQWSGRAAALLHLAQRGTGLRQDWTHQACDAARLLASDLGCPPEVTQALEQVYERWDGQGFPNGLHGQACSELARLALAAHWAVMAWHDQGADGARHLLVQAAGRQLEPRLLDSALACLPALDQADFASQGCAQVTAHVTLAPVPQMAAAFGDFADLQSPFTIGHARRVHALANQAAVLCNLPLEQRNQLGLAASLHDLGQVALPTSLWLQARPWRPGERASGGMHPAHGQRILAGASLLQAVAPMVGGHHPVAARPAQAPWRGLSPAQQAGHLLAAAEMACGLREDRPHRPSLSLQAQTDTLHQAGRSGTLHPEAVHATVQCLGLVVSQRHRADKGLTDREHQVLVHLAQGATNKHIARLLGISDRTVQTYTLHLYQKLGVRTRAGAALMAARMGLIEPSA